ncbi:MAG: hypothetical protein IPK31_11840 [Chitinophagaceae bacterium]|nr:hypothetical protein [Chitinophagaceae bacterium]
MKITKQNNLILFLSLTVAAYFIFLITADKLHYRPVLLGVIVEILTIPALLLMLTMFIISVIRFVKSKYKVASFTFVSIIIQLATMIFLVTNS